MRYKYFIFIFSFDIIKHVKFAFGKVDIFQHELTHAKPSQANKSTSIG